eukprot:scaffold129221_cov28-Tisochrysis_lutea.AAC.2
MTTCPPSGLWQCAPPPKPPRRLLAFGNPAAAQQRWPNPVMNESCFVQDQATDDCERARAFVQFKRKSKSAAYDCPKK